jgi:hypothetical protein
MRNEARMDEKKYLLIKLGDKECRLSLGWLVSANSAS